MIGNQGYNPLSFYEQFMWRYGHWTVAARHTSYDVADNDDEDYNDGQDDDAGDAPLLFFD